MALPLPLGVAPSAGAIPPEKKALVRELIVLSGTEKDLKTLASQIFSDSSSEISESLATVLKLYFVTETNKTEAEVDALVPESTARVMARLRDLLAQRLDIVQLVEQILYPLYEKYFTVAELQDLIAFYKTPTGQKVANVQTKLYLELTQQATVAMAPTIEQIYKQALEEEKARITQTPGGR